MKNMQQTTKKECKHYCGQFLTNDTVREIQLYSEVIPGTRSYSIEYISLYQMF